MYTHLIAQAAGDFSNTAADAAAANAAAAASVAAGGFVVVMMVLSFVFWIGALVLFIIALIDVIRREFPNPNDKILWIILIIVLTWLGPILYFIIGKKKGTLPGVKSTPSAQAPPAV